MDFIRYAHLKCNVCIETSPNLHIHIISYQIAMKQHHLEMCIISHLTQNNGDVINNQWHQHQDALTTTFLIRNLVKDYFSVANGGYFFQSKPLPNS